MRRLLFINFSKTSSRAFLLFLVSVVDVPTMFRECLNSILSYALIPFSSRNVGAGYFFPIISGQLIDRETTSTGDQ